MIYGTNYAFFVIFTSKMEIKFVTAIELNNDCCKFLSKFQSYWVAPRTIYLFWRSSQSFNIVRCSAMLENISWWIYLEIGKLPGSRVLALEDADRVRFRWQMPFKCWHSVLCRLDNPRSRINLSWSRRTWQTSLTC